MEKTITVSRLEELARNTIQELKDLGCNPDDEYFKAIMFSLRELAKSRNIKIECEKVEK